MLKRTALPKRVLVPRRNVAELPISPCTSVETCGASSTSSSLLSSNLSSSNVSFSVTASTVLTCASEAIEIGFSAVSLRIAFDA